jgi:hypothetical protein
MPKGMTFSLVSSSTLRLSSFPSELLTELLARGGMLFLLLGGRRLEPGRGPDRRQEDVKEAFLGKGRGFFADLFF